MKLTDRSLQTLRPQDRPYKRADGRGLSILVTPQGNKLWRFRYRYLGKERMLSLGTYPDVPLASARAERDRLRILLASGEDPSAIRRTQKLGARQAVNDTFGILAGEYLEKREAEGIAPRTLKKLRTLTGALLPDLGDVPIRDITPQALLAALKKHEARGKRTLAHEARALAGRIFRYAAAQGRVERDISQDIGDALLTPVVKGYAAITNPHELGKLLRAVEGYSGDPVTRNCLLLLARLFVRPSELREARWEEFDLDAGVWRIPASRTKLRREHIVPLPPQAIALLQELQQIGPSQEFVAGSRVKSGQPVSDMTFNKALRSLAYDRHTHVAHGFRSSASTMLNEQGYNRDWIERQLAHVERNKVRGAYNAAEYMGGRTQMMREWNDYLDGLTKGI